MMFTWKIIRIFTGKNGWVPRDLVEDFTSKDGFFGSQKGGFPMLQKWWRRRKKWWFGGTLVETGDVSGDLNLRYSSKDDYSTINSWLQRQIWNRMESHFPIWTSKLNGPMASLGPHCHIHSYQLWMGHQGTMQPLPASPQQDICTRRSYLDSDRWSCTAWPTVGLTPPILDKGLLLQCNESPFHWVPNSSNWGINWTYNIGIVWAFKRVFCWINQSIFNIHTQFIPIGIFWINGSIYIYIYIYIHCIDIDIHI